MIKMFSILILMVLKWVYTFVKTLQTVPISSVYTLSYVKYTSVKWI